MNRSELIRRMVLNSICDDYENVDQVILPDVVRDSAKFGFTVERADVVNALAGLIEDGLAKAYLLSSREPEQELQGYAAAGRHRGVLQNVLLHHKKGNGSSSIR